MGRLLGIPHFLSMDALLEERADTTTIRKAKSSEGNEDGQASRHVQSEIALRMQRKFEGRIIHRTISSKDWQGEDLIKLPGYDEVLLVVKPTTREMEIISEHADNTKESYVVSSL